MDMSRSKYPVDFLFAMAFKLICEYDDGPQFMKDGLIGLSNLQADPNPLLIAASGEEVCIILNQVSGDGQ